MRFFRDIKLFLLFVILSISNIVLSQTISKYDSIDNYVSNYMAEKKVPGFAVCLVKDSTMIWSKSYGLADIKNNIPLSIDAIMNIGSISKTFTATAAMQLWEKGLIDLEADINKYLDFKIRNPNYPDKPITISQILTHTSSIQDGKAYHHSYSCGDPTISLNEWIVNNLTPEGKYYFDGSNFGDWSPGTKDEYSNVAFGLLGLIIEKVTRQPFNEYCKENIFEPLNMNNTGWLLSEIDTSKHIRPYAYVFEENRNDIVENKRLYPNESEFVVGSYVENCLYSFPNYPDGLVRTTVKELSRYLIAIINGGEYNGSRILKSETLNKMLSLQIEGNNSQGLCWHTFEIDSTWGHTGGDPGIATYLIFNQKNKIGIITFQNNCVGGQMKIIKKLYQIAEDE
jgi:CubicO group peptidase (beta-lactamase class C family)